MRTLCYSTKKFEQPFLEAANNGEQELHFTQEPLSQETLHLAKGFRAISIFTGDDASGPVLMRLGSFGVGFIAVRATGYDNVDLTAAANCGITVGNVPAYSPYAIAEHAVALMLALNRKLILAYTNGQRHNFLLDNLVGFDLHGKTIGIIGTGAIGSVLAKIMHGFGCRLLAFDLAPRPELTNNFKVQYVSLENLCRQSDVISLHLPLNEGTRYLINDVLIKKMKKGVFLINTARGAIVNTEDVIAHLKTGHIAGYGADVYDRERGVFFFDRSRDDIKDLQLQELLNLPNVLLTPHQGFATNEAMRNIAATTFTNLRCWKNGKTSGNELTRVSLALSGKSA